MGINQMGGVQDRLSAPNNGLKVTWFNHWHPALDEAIQVLPEMDSCPHDLFRLLVQNQNAHSKRIAFITKKGEPVAIIPLYGRGQLFQQYEISTWFIPGALFPAMPGYLIPALESLRVEVWVSWRRMQCPPPSSSLARFLKETQVHILNCEDDFESFWRSNGFFKTVRNMRNRCKDFTVTVNAPGAAEWTIRNAVAKWRGNSAKTSRDIDDWAVNDWITVAKYWEARDRHFTIQLLDDGKPIGGATNLAHGDDLVGGLVYRDPDYNWHGVGIRILDLCSSLTAEKGFKTLDFGGDAEYKKVWAPQEGSLFLFNICPEPLFQAKQALNRLRSFTRH